MIVYPEGFCGRPVAAGLGFVSTMAKLQVVIAINNHGSA
jgi:hypothetical protein